MKDIVADRTLVACCGLYCGACGRYLREKCPGCRENSGATWCKVRTCCLENSRATCAECAEHADVNSCGWFHNFISRVFGLVFNSNRKACIDRIRQAGTETFAAEMAARKRQSLPRK